MAQQTHDSFEDSLKEILQPDDTRKSATLFSSDRAGVSPNMPATVDSLSRLRGKPPISRSVETAVRIIAGIIVLVLLILFGTNIASR
jgi:hypothetical protein